MIKRILDKNLHTWMGGYAGHLVRRARRPRPPAHRHLLFALCDHFEPMWGRCDAAVGDARSRAWRDGYPALVAEFRDADGRPPRHSFFFPGDQYKPGFLDDLARLAAAGLAEVELHLHHDGDTRATLSAKIEESLAWFAGHGHLSRDPDGRLRYGFIHGDWALANARKSGKNCGVDDELDLLWETGCYADYTFPSAPDPCQPQLVNQIVWPMGELTRRRPYDRAEPARVGVVHQDRPLLITGPLALTRRPSRLAIRIENGGLTGVDPPNPTRVDDWVAQDIHIEGRPEWVFVKVYTHGAPEPTAASLLGDGGRVLHQTLTERYNDGRRWSLHYVTAREMYNIARAALAGESGDPGRYRDYVLAPPPVTAG